MNRIRRLRQSLACLPRRVGALAAFAAAPVAWRPDRPFSPGWKLPPGWNNYLQLPPGWRKHPPLGHVVGPVYRIPARIPAHTTLMGFTGSARAGQQSSAGDSVPVAAGG